MIENENNEEIRRYKAKAIKLKLLLDNGIISNKEFLEMRKELLKEAKI